MEHNVNSTLEYMNKLANEPNKATNRLTDCPTTHTPIVNVTPTLIVSSNGLVTYYYCNCGNC